MLMAWGPFRFTVPTYSVEGLKRSVQPRLSPQPIIGAMPTVHRLGPSNEKITLESTFFPQHLNGGGLAQLAGIRHMVNTLQPQMLVSVNGAALNIFGLWIAEGLDDTHEDFDAAGRPTKITASLTLLQYSGNDARSAAIGALLAGGLSLGFGF